MSIEEVGPLRAEEAQVARELGALAMRAVQRGSRPAPYLRRHLAEHALAGGVLGPGTLPVRVLPYLDLAQLWAALGQRDPEAPVDVPAMAQLRQIAHVWDWARPERNAAALALWAALDGVPLGEPLNSSWHVRWAGRRPDPGIVLGRYPGVVWAVAAARLPSGRPVAISSDGEADATLRLWDLDTGLPVLAVAVPGGPVLSLAIHLPATGPPVAVSGGTDGTVRTWDLDAGVPLGRSRPGHDGPVPAVTTEVVAGEPLAISGGEDGTVRAWRLDGSPAGPVLRLGDDLRTHREAGPETGSVRAITTVALPGGPAVVAGGSAGVLVAWDLATWRRVGEPMRGHPGAIRALTALGPGVLVSGDTEGVVLRWDLAEGTRTGLPMPTPGRPVTGLSGPAGRAPGAGTVLIAGQDRSVLAWDPDTGEEIGRADCGTPITLTSVAVVAGSPVAVTGGRDGAVRRWDLRFPAPRGPKAGDHLDNLGAVATASLPGVGPVVLTGGADYAVRLWRLDSGHPVGQALTGHRSFVVAIATALTRHFGQVVVAGAFDGSVLAWRAGDGRPVGERLESADGAVVGLTTLVLDDGRAALVTVAWNGVTTVRELAPGWPVLATAAPTETSARCVTTMPWAGRFAVVTGGADGLLRIWDPHDGAALRTVDTGTAVSALAVAGALAVTGCPDGTLRTWDLDSGDLVATARDPHPGGVLDVVTAELPAGRGVAVSGGADAEVRVSDLLTGEPVGEGMPTPDRPRLLGLHPGPRPVLVIGGAGVAVAELRHGDPGAAVPDGGG